MNKKFWIVALTIIALSIVFVVACIVCYETGGLKSIFAPKPTVPQSAETGYTGETLAIPDVSEGEQSSTNETEMIPPPWEMDGKEPYKYTWAEFEALSAEHQEMFFEWFASAADFSAWQAQAMKNNGMENIPWENGGKIPSAYTWKEFESLSPALQELFFDWFDTAEDFDAWQKRAQNDGGAADAPWANGGKQPDEYTWAEFQALSAEDQELFFQWFESAEDFAVWQQQAQNDGGIADAPWANGGKQPDEYTWKEFESLSPALQELFFDWFETAEDFAAWQKRAQNDGGAADAPWANGGKQPDEYTWAEFQALSAENQELFFEWFGSADAFQAWMERVQP